MRLTVDRERCIGSGLCVLTAPDSFDQSEEDGRVVLRAGPARLEGVREAVGLCPSGALSLVDEHSPDPDPAMGHHPVRTDAEGPRETR